MIPFSVGIKNHGATDQEKAINRIVEANQLDCVEIMHLESPFFLEAAESRDLQRLKRMLEDRKVRGVVIPNLDRLGRASLGGVSWLLDVLKKVNVGIFTKDGQLNLMASPYACLANYR